MCRKEQPFVIRPAKSHDNSMDVNPESPSAMETDNIRQVDSIEASTSGTASPKVDIQELKVGKPGKFSVLPLFLFYLFKCNLMTSIASFYCKD